jgi:hypothetical protein
MSAPSPDPQASESDGKASAGQTKGFWSGVWSWFVRLPANLDVLLRIGERLLALSWMATVFFLGYRAVTSDSVEKVIKALAEDWKGALLVLIPLFYLTVRTFLEEVVEAFGMKRRHPITPAGGSSTEETVPATREEKP